MLDVNTNMLNLTYGDSKFTVLIVQIIVAAIREVNI